jgi:tetratricopeptide (TPR) repeat protein
MLKDAYGETLSTASVAARDAYVEGVDLFLAAQPGAEAAFARARQEDPAFALAHLAEARALQMLGDIPAMRACLARAEPLAAATTGREQAHGAILTDAMSGRGAQALERIRAHARHHPRDAMAMQPAMGVFGLIGFSGLPGREAAQLDFTTSLAEAYGDEWWFLGCHAFAQMEYGDLDAAQSSIDRSMAQRPDSANGAHYLSHLYYEKGETEVGLSYLDAWRQDYDRSGLMHTHIAWHVALWSLAAGEVERMWQVVDADVAPGASWGPAINVVTDMAAILHRAEMAGVQVSPDRWRALSAYTGEVFPKPGIAFVDSHAALAHAMAGDEAALRRIIEGAKGPAGEVVRALAEGFGAMAAGDWQAAKAHLGAALSDHARIGGSRAQRDLVEYAYANVLLRLGEGEAARRRLQQVRGRTALGVAPVQ